MKISRQWIISLVMTVTCLPVTTAVAMTPDSGQQRMTGYLGMSSSGDLTFPSDYDTTPGMDYSIEDAMTLAFYYSQFIDQNWSWEVGLTYKTATDMSARLVLPNPGDNSMLMDIKSIAEISVTQFMANSLYEVQSGPMSAYVGLGIGFAQISLKDSKVTVDGTTLFNVDDSHANNLVWQYLIGMKLAIDEDWYFDARFTYANLGKLKLELQSENYSQKSVDSLTSKQFLIGVGQYIH